MTYYDLLDINPTASKSEIKKAYFKKIKIYTNENNPDEFAMLTKAYKTLSSDEGRESYNQFLNQDEGYAEKIEEVEFYINKEAYSRALEIIENISPQDEELKYYKVVCLFYLGNYYEAERTIKPLLINYSNNTTYLEMFTRIKMATGDKENAIKFLNKLIKLEPYEGNYYLTLSNIYVEKEDYQQALHVLERKLQRGNEVFEDFPLLLEAFYLVLLLNDISYKSQILNRFINLPSTYEQEEILINFLINETETLAPSHQFHLPIVELISEINNNKSDEINNWLSEVQYADLNHNNESVEAEEFNGKSPFWPAVIIAIISSIIFTPLAGIVIGIIYYFKSDSINKLIGYLGCFIIVILILGAALGML